MTHMKDRKQVTAPEQKSTTRVEQVEPQLYHRKMLAHYQEFFEKRKESIVRKYMPLMKALADDDTATWIELDEAKHREIKALEASHQHQLDFISTQLGTPVENLDCIAKRIASERPAKRQKFDTNQSSKAPTETVATSLGKDTTNPEVPGADQKTIMYAEVRRNAGDLGHWDTIVEYPQRSQSWYVLFCEEHGIRFRQSAIGAAAKHLSSQRYHKLPRSYPLAVQTLGHRILDCTSELAKCHNDDVEEQYRKGYVPFNAMKTGRVATTWIHWQASEQVKATEPSVSQNHLIPKCFYIYYGQYRDARGTATVWPCMILGWDNQTLGGLPTTLELTGLLHADPPKCYIYGKHKIVGWAPGYEEGGRLVQHREYPVMWFDEEKSTSWMPVNLISKFPLEAKNAPKRKTHPEKAFNDARNFIARREGYDRWADREKAREEGRHARWDPSQASKQYFSDDDESDYADSHEAFDSDVDEEEERAKKADHNERIEEGEDTRLHKLCVAEDFNLRSITRSRQPRAISPEALPTKSAAKANLPSSLRVTGKPEAAHISACEPESQALSVDVTKGADMALTPQSQGRSRQKSPHVITPGECLPSSRLALPDAQALETQHVEAMPVNDPQQRPLPTLCPGASTPICLDEVAEAPLDNKAAFEVSHYADRTVTWASASPGNECYQLYKTAEGHLKVLGKQGGPINIAIEPLQVEHIHFTFVTRNRLVKVTSKDGGKFEIMFDRGPGSQLASGLRQARDFVDWAKSLNPNIGTSCGHD